MFAKNNKPLRIAYILVGIEGLAAVLWITGTRSAEGSVLFGLSAFRLGLAAVILAVSIGFLVLGWQWDRRLRLTDKLARIGNQHATGLVVLAFWGAVGVFLLQSELYFKLFVRPVSTIDPDIFFLRLRPALVWGALALIQFGVAITLAFRDHFNAPDRRPVLAWLTLGLKGWFTPGRKPAKIKPLANLTRRTWIEALIWLGLLAVWGLVALTGIGVIPDDRFWNVAGVPVLPQQVILTGLFLLLLLDIKHALPTGKLVQLSQKRAFLTILMAAIWLAAVLVWNGETLYHTYFAPGPFAPNYVHYPFSDARAFDIGGQYFLLGKGLNNGFLTDRPFLMLFFALLHAIGGQNYDQYIIVQVMILALIPIPLFLLGWKLHSKTAGLGIALMMILKEKNAIAAAAEIGLVNVKVLMSEMPTALLLAALSLCLFIWLRSGRSVRLFVSVLAGGILGLSVGVRGNTLAVLPVALVITMLGYGFQKGWFKPWAISTGLFLLCFVLVLTPYSIKTTRQYGAPFWWIKIQNVIDRNKEETPLDFYSISDNFNRPSLSLAPKPVSLKTKSFVLPENTFTLTLRHFAHNEIMSVFSLPLDWSVKPIDWLTATPLWDYDVEWLGELQPGEKISLAVNLLVLAFGIGFAIRRWGINGLTPLAIHLGYNLSNSVARTSGGRYLAPADWALLLYFVLGFLAVVSLLRKWELPPTVIPAPSANKSRLIGLILFLFAFLLLGSAFLLADLIPEKYAALAPNESLDALSPADWDLLSEAGIMPNEIRAFIGSENSVVELGWALYPRFMKTGEIAVTSSHLPVMPDNLGRVTFLLLTDPGPHYILLPLVDQYPQNFPNAVNGLVLGCQKEEYVEGKIFIPLLETGKQIFLQRPFTWSCETP